MMPLPRRPRHTARCVLGYPAGRPLNGLIALRNQWAQTGDLIRSGLSAPMAILYLGAFM
jgi:hypothetical protein